MVTAKKMSARDRRRFVIIGSVAAVVGVVGFVVWLNYAWILWNQPTLQKQLEDLSLRTFGDAWEKESQKLSGGRAINCGRVRVRENPAIANECALSAFREGKPFRVRYDLQGIDSDVSAGLVYTPKLDLYGLVFDGDPAGQGGTSWSRQRVGKVACPLPYELKINPNGRLNCFKQEGAAHGDVMSPNLESY